MEPDEDAVIYQFPSGAKVPRLVWSLEQDVNDILDAVEDD